MEHHVQSVDDALIGGLSYKLKAGASYVTNRRSVSYFASGGNSYSSNGVKVIKFNLNGDQWLDPSTFRVMFQLNNTGNANLAEGATAKSLHPLSWNPAAFFRRARLLCAGVVLEDIDDFNRLSLMVTSLKSQDEQLSIAAEGFGNFDQIVDNILSANDSRSTYRLHNFEQGGLIKTSRRAVFKPLFGLFEQDKLIPLRYAPLVIELELVNNPGDALLSASTYSEHWNITDTQCKCDLLTLDNSLDNEYASHLLSGKSLPINFATWSHTNQSTGNDKNFSANIHRALSRLKSIFITLNSADTEQYKTVNNFYHPMATAGGVPQNDDPYEIEDEHSVQIQIGSKVVPEYPISSVTEATYQLKELVGSSTHIYGRWYRTHRYIIGLDLEKISGAGFTGMSTKTGEQLTINFKDCDSSNAAITNSIPTRMFCALHYDCVLNIQDSGVQVLD